MNLQALRMARQLESLPADVIEAGFPASSVGDFEAVHAIANAVTDVRVAAPPARQERHPIDRAWRALNGTRNPRIHVFLATSYPHAGTSSARPRIRSWKWPSCAVYAAKYTNNVEFSAEDASRSILTPRPRVFSHEVSSTPGATTINVRPIPSAMPSPGGEYGKLIKHVIETPRIPTRPCSACIATTTLGLAVANNSLSAIQNGARQAK